MALHITGHDSICLHTIIKEGHTALPIDLHLGYIFDPVPMLEGTRIQEWSLLMLSYAWGPLPWVPLAWLLLSEGPGLPSLVPSSPCSLKATLLLMPLSRGSCRWSAPNCYNDNNASPPSGCLSWPLQGTPWIPLWPHWCHWGPLFPLLCPSQHSPLPGASSTWQVC